MKVKELIREQKKMPGDLPVVTDAFEGEVEVVKQTVRTRCDGWGGPGMAYRAEQCVLIGKDLLKGVVR